MEKYNHSQPPADFAHITCDYCVEHPSPAAKTCLKCEASFCALHLKPHLIHKTLSLHTLIEPVADLRGLQCPDHKVVLQFYCKDDALCVCGCCITGKHRSHTLLSLDQAQAVIKEELERENKRLRELFQNCSIKQQDLAGLEADIKTRINELKGKLSKSFSEWRRQLEEDEEYTLKLIDEEGLRTLSQITNCSEALNKRMEQMTLIDGETQSLVQRDPLSFIQNSKQLLSRVTETQRVTDPDVPALTLNLSNISQLIQKRLNGCEKYHSDILGIIMSASTEYRGSSNITPSPHRSSGAALVPENVLQLSNGISGRAGISQVILVCRTVIPVCYTLLPVCCTVIQVCRTVILVCRTVIPVCYTLLPVCCTVILICSILFPVCSTLLLTRIQNSTRFGQLIPSCLKPVTQ
ncbi:tripartite motif-containing protein 29-like isoform X3 [Heterodontus francisci]|uniref:tripartite motif-containing protein 29-like isoform X3 n=1 Tax=Heterodontus francisci TaxID=7792 RepID=UPI00355C469E